MRTHDRMAWIRRVPPLLGVVATLACHGEDGASAAAGDPQRIAPPPSPPYETVPLEEFGRIEGTVAWEGPPPRDTVLPVADSLARICGGASVRLTPVRVVRGGVTGSVVWLSNARRGKALSASRRFEITTDRCRLLPAAQPAIAGGMLNVLSLDRLVHRLQFVRVGNEGTVDRVEQFDAGQVVPLESVLRLAGPVTVRSDRFPWMEAWIHVFDHPYYAMSGDGGGFAIDSIPPGRYRLAYWHAVTGQRDTVVVVVGGDTARIRVSLPGEGH